VLSVSSRLTEKLSATVGFPAHRIVTIRNGVDTHRFTPASRDDARQALGLERNELVVGAVGRLLPVKDQQSFLRALGLLARSGLRFTAIIAGDGPLKDELAAVAQAEGLGSRVRLIGERSDVESVLAALDIFVLSSISEGLSNTILEAMASGVPVVATAVGGADELVVHGRTGLLVPSRDEQALAGAIRTLADDPARRAAMGVEGRRRAEEHFSVARMVEAYEDLYVSLSGNGAPSQPLPRHGRSGRHDGGAISAA
jgi:glycosyltransferase involved in cell wall biosynthesis